MVASLNNSFPVKDQFPNLEVSRLRTITASTTITAEQHDGQLILVDAAAGLTVTLPAASGTGSRYRFVIKTTITSNSTVIKVANTTDGMIGFAHLTGDDTSALGGFSTTAGTDDTITLDGSTRGGFAGDVVEVEDIASGLFRVAVYGHATGTEATPFTATV